jgi:EamA domain-containing membrane protein RarD
VFLGERMDAMQIVAFGIALLGVLLATTGRDAR